MQPNISLLRTFAHFCLIIAVGLLIKIDCCQCILLHLPSLYYKYDTENLKKNI